MAADEASSSFEAKTSLFFCYFCSGLYTKRRQIDGKIRYVAIFSVFEKKYVVNVYKICSHLVVFLYWSMIALLGPRFLKMKYCSFATCVCY